MGTTVTSNLALIKPDTSEKIQEALPTYAGWATQNGANCDTIDALFRCSTHTWTPTWTATANPTLGATGFVEGKYLRVHPRLVIGFVRIYTGGAGFATGTGAYNITPPVAMDTAIDGFANEVPIGKAVWYDDSAVATSSVFNVMYSTASDLIFFRPPLGDPWSSLLPVVPAQQDRMSATFMYPTAAA